MGIAPEAVSFKPSHSGATLTGQIRGCPNVDDPMRAACGRDETAGDAFEMRRIAGRWRGRDQSRFSAHDLPSRCLGILSSVRQEPGAAPRLATGEPAART